MNERIKKIRDEGARDCTYEMFRFCTLDEQVKFYPKIQAQYQAGFDTAHDLLMKDAKELVEALANCLDNCQEFTWEKGSEAENALAKWHERWGS